jgi:hypothetical protein
MLLHRGACHARDSVEIVFSPSPLRLFDAFRVRQSGGAMSGIADLSGSLGSSIFRRLCPSDEKRLYSKALDRF